MHTTIDDYLTTRLNMRLREVCFYAASLIDKNGNPLSVNVCARVDDGQVGKLIKRMKQRGGIGGTDDAGVLRFIPWPPAVIECGTFSVSWHR